MSISKFFKEAIAYRLAGGHAADHAAMGVILKNKLQAGMAAAERLNPVDFQPWLPPTDLSTGLMLKRINSTAYPAGIVVCNNAGTHQFVARVGGTTTTAEPTLLTTPLTTSGTFNMGDITDGGVTWNWMGAVRTPVALTGAPSMLLGTKPSQLTTRNNFAPQGSGNAGGPAYNNIFRFVGGPAFTGVNTNWQAWVRGPSTTATSRSTDLAGNYRSAKSSVVFMTDAPYIALDLATGGTFPNTAQFGLEIDGRRIWDGNVQPVVTPSAGSGYVLVDLRSSGPRKARKVKIHINTSYNGYGCFWTSPTDSVWFPGSANDYKMCVVGDSITYGSNSGPLVSGWDLCTQVGSLIGCDDVWLEAVGGTGFIATNGIYDLTYIQRIADVIAASPDVVYIHGCYNDQASAGATLVTAILTYLQALHAGLPKAMIIMSGTYGGAGTNTVASGVEANQITAMAQFADPNSYFIPVSTATPPWIVNGGTLTSTTGTGNSDIYVGSTDTVHSSQNGIDYLAQKHANAIKNLVNSLT